MFEGSAQPDRLTDCQGTIILYGDVVENRSGTHFVVGARSDTHIELGLYDTWTDEEGDIVSGVKDYFDVGMQEVHGSFKVVKCKDCMRKLLPWQDIYCDRCQGPALSRLATWIKGWAR